MAKDVLIRLFEDSQSPGTCRGCGTAIDWFETYPKKARMPMNRGAVPRKSEQDPETWRVVAFFSADDSHWSTCPDATKFS